MSSSSNDFDKSKSNNNNVNNNNTNNNTGRSRNKKKGADGGSGSGGRPFMFFSSILKKKKYLEIDEIREMKNRTRSEPSGERERESLQVLIESINAINKFRICNNISSGLLWNTIGTCATTINCVSINIKSNTRTMWTKSGSW